MPPLRKSVKARLANLGIYGKPKNARKAATGKAGASKKTSVRGTEEYGGNAGQTAEKTVGETSSHLASIGNSVAATVGSTDPPAVSRPSTTPADPAACAVKALPVNTTVRNDDASPVHAQ